MSTEPATTAPADAVVTSSEFCRACVGLSAYVNGRDFVVTNARGNRIELVMCESELEAQRRKLGLTQKEVAAATHMSQSKLSKVESGAVVSPDARARLRKFYANRSM